MFIPYSAMGNNPASMIDPDGMIFLSGITPWDGGGMSADMMEANARWDRFFFGSVLGNNMFSTTGGG